MKNLLILASFLVVGLLAGCAGNTNQMNNSDADDRSGIITVPSSNSVDETYQNLKDAIERNDALSVIAELDHRQNAASVNMQLRPTRILMLGNPRLGTPLMQARQVTGLDLPQKLLVYEDAGGQVFIAYNNPEYLAGRHDIEGQDEGLEKIAGALKNLAETAAR